MVAVVTGVGLGLERSSASLIGAGGVLGAPAQGQSGDQVYVNATTGNLIDQRTDQILTGIGLDDVISETYNSLGSYSPGLGVNDGWMGDYQRQVTGLTGTVDTAGSTVTHTAADGSNVVYTWNAAQNAYVGNEDGGAYDTITYNASANQWTWTDGKTQLKEVYDGANGGRIMTSTNTNGDVLTYSYTGALLTSVTTTDSGGHQDSTNFVYNAGGQLTEVATSYWNTPTSSQQTLTQVYYTYDSQGRLSTVTTALTPQDNSVSTGGAYVTTYGYSGTSNLITSITQSDGSSLQIAYNASNQVSSLTQTLATGVTATTTFSYAAGQTTITDPLGNQTTLVYDAKGELTQTIVNPAGLDLVTNYTYDATGHLTSVTNPDGTSVTYTYDANGNQLSQVNLAGNTTTWTYGSNNQLLSQTEFLTPQQGSTAASNPVTTWYVYNNTDNLTYTVTSLGQVTQYQYNAQGEQTSVIQYTADTFTGSTGAPLAPTAASSSQTIATNSTSDAIALSLGGGVASNIAIVTQPTNGALSVNGASVTYTPNAGFVGTDSFQYTAINAGGVSSLATVTLNVTNANSGVPLAPMGGPDDPDGHRKLDQQCDLAQSFGRAGDQPDHHHPAGPRHA